MNANLETIDWSLCTPEGQELDELRRWSALPLMSKLYALEEMCDQARAVVAGCHRAGRPYIDPFTGEAVLPRAGSEPPVWVGDAGRPA